MWRVLDMALLAMMLIACVSDGTSSVDPQGRFSLVVVSAAYRGELAGVSPATGRSFVDVEIQLTDIDASPALGTSPTFFTLITAANIRVAASPTHTYLLSSPCSIDLAAQAGGLLTCHLAFEAPSGDAPVTLVYSDEHMRSQNAAIGPLSSVHDYQLPAGMYTLKTSQVLDSGCAYKPFNYLTLLSSSEFRFAEILDPVTSQPLAVPRVDDRGSVTVSMHVDGACSFDVTTDRSFIVTADFEFDYLATMRQTNRTGGCGGLLTCTGSVRMHYGKP